MKNIFVYLTLAVTLMLTACHDDEINAPQSLPVNYANLAGIWQLKEWNGEELGEDRYCYLIINRKADEDGNRALEMYQNMDTYKSRYITSTYELKDDDKMDEDPTTAIISGMYDHNAGFWSNDYIVSEVEATRMVWTVADDAEDVSVYVRCDEVPEDILVGTRTLR